MKRSLSWLAAAVLFAPAALFAAEADQQFAEKAAHGNALEVELGTLAQEQAESEDVKEFGQKLVEDHSQAQEELAKAATEMGIELPEGLDAKGEEMKQKLSQLSGSDFDRAYMEEMVSDHKKDIAAYEAFAEQAESPVQAYAMETLRTLRAHREMAEKLHQEVQ